MEGFQWFEEQGERMTWSNLSLRETVLEEWMGWCVGRLWKVEMRDKMAEKRQCEERALSGRLEDWLRWFGWGKRQGVEDREKEQPAAWKCVTGSSLKKMMLKTGKMWGLGAGWKGGWQRHKIWILFRGCWVWSTSRASRYRYCQLLWGVLEKFIWGFAEVG